MFFFFFSLAFEVDVFFVLCFMLCKVTVAREIPAYAG